MVRDCLTVLRGPESTQRKDVGVTFPTFVLLRWWGTLHPIDRGYVRSRMAGGGTPRESEKDLDVKCVRRVVRPILRGNRYVGTDLEGRTFGL